MSRTRLLTRFPVPAPGVALAFLLGCPGGETRHDAYMKALQMEAEAERGPCKLTFDGAVRAQVLTSGQVAACLKAQEAALAQYERARDLGMAGDVAFERAYARARQRRDRLVSMRKNVARLERERLKARVDEGPP